MCMMMAFGCYPCVLSSHANIKQVGQLWELKGESVHKIRAYAAAARQIEALPVSLQHLVDTNQLHGMSINQVAIQHQQQQQQKTTTYSIQSSSLTTAI